MTIYLHDFITIEVWQEPTIHTVKVAKVKEWSGLTRCQCLGPRGTNVLQFGKPPAPKPVVVETPEPPVEVLGTCSDGRPQLPLASTEGDLRRASLAQVKDWQARRLAANPKEAIMRRKGFHAGSSIFS